MSITIGIYDLFAYTIPGFLYLYVINEFFRVIGWQSFQIDQIKDGNGLFFAVIATICAFVVGHLFDVFANWFCFRILTRYRIKDASLDTIKEKFPNLKIRFETNDWDPLFTMIRQRNLEFSRVIDSFGAANILLRNICFGLLLLSFLYIRILILDFTWSTLTVVIGILVLSWVAFHRSKMFYFWFFMDIYNASLEYGTSLKEVIEFNRKEKSTQKRRTKNNA